MSASPVDQAAARAGWQQANLAFVDALGAALESAAGGERSWAEHVADLDAARAACDPAPALDRLADLVGLTDFERDLLALALAAELRPRLRAGLGVRAGTAPCGPTFALAAGLLDRPHWSALSPARPLRAAELVEVGPGPLPDAPIQVPERVLHHLLGLDDLDAGLALTVVPLEATGALVASHEAAADSVVAGWRHDPTWPPVWLDADRRRDARLVAGRVCALAGLPGHVLRAVDLPADATERAVLARRWRRELTLAPRVLLLDVGEPTAGAAADAFVDAVVGPVLVSGRRPDSVAVPRQVQVRLPGDDEQKAAWDAALARHLDGRARRLCPAVERVVGQFRLGAAEIDEIAAGIDGAEQPGLALWEACRATARPALDALAQRVVSTATWDDLVLPDAERETLETVARHVEHRAAVQRAFGLRPGGRGSGVTALFHGPSGTGKTLAAEVIAHDVGLDLYRIDLSAVVSKYIGETEKNLRAIFDAAEDGGAVLLFDEADALFGKRTEVRDSHDRYANIEVSYLLTRMETYRGLAVLTTNARASLDAAFVRRLRFVVGFPFPDEAQRALIWSRAFPVGVPTRGLHPERLARLGVTGATIHQIALHAGYEAVVARSAVTPEHVLRAATRELAKVDRALTAAETAGLR